MTYQQCTTQARPAGVTQPVSKPTFDSKATAAEIQQAKCDHTADMEAYLTQEGCRQGLTEFVIDNTPRNCITELVDYKFGFQNFAPLMMMKQLIDEANAANIK